MTFPELLSGRYITRMIRREDNDPSYISFNMEAFEFHSYKTASNYGIWHYLDFIVFFIYPDSNFLKIDQT